MDFLCPGFSVKRNLLHYGWPTVALVHTQKTPLGICENNKLYKKQLSPMWCSDLQVFFHLSLQASLSLMESMTLALCILFFYLILLFLVGHFTMAKWVMFDSCFWCNVPVDDAISPRLALTALVLSFDLLSMITRLHACPMPKSFSMHCDDAFAENAGA